MSNNMTNEMKSIIDGLAGLQEQVILMQSRLAAQYTVQTRRPGLLPTPARDPRPIADPVPERSNLSLEDWPYLPHPQNPHTRVRERRHRAERREWRNYNTKEKTLITNFVHITQINRAQHIWERVPPSLQHRLDMVEEILSPPLQDEEWHRKKKETFGNISKLLLQLTQEHLNNQKSKTLDELKSLSPSTEEEVHKAKEAARNRLRLKFGDKMAAEHITANLDEAANTVQRVNPAPTPQNQENEEHTNIQEPRGTRMGEQADRSTTPNNNDQAPGTPRVTPGNTNSPSPPAQGKHNRPPLSFTIATNNRFSALPVDPDVETEDEEQIQPTIRTKTTKKRNTGPSPTILQENKRRRVTDSEEEIDSSGDLFVEEVKRKKNSLAMYISLEPPKTGVKKETIHTNFKHATAKLTPRPDCQVLTIADSQLRPATKLPSDWNLQIFPGLNLEHATRLINNTHFNKYPNLDTIVLHVGTNNRKWRESTNNTEISKLAAALKRTDKNYLITGVSIPNTFNALERRTTEALNTELERKFSDRFIHPLDPTQVTISNSDSYRIHYDANTVDLICTKIYRNFHLVRHRQGQD